MPNLTVKELKAILDTCNDDAIILIADDCGTGPIVDNQIFATPDGKSVVFDPSYVEEIESK